MATEERLIDISKPLRIFRKWVTQLGRPEDAGDKNGVESCISLLEEAPTVDAVEVVRCKDCKFGEMCSIREAMACTDENGFCWRGERRT